MKNLKCPSCSKAGGVFPMVAGDYGCYCGFVGYHLDFYELTNDEIDELDENSYIKHRQITDDKAQRKLSISLNIHKNKIKT